MEGIVTFVFVASICARIVSRREPRNNFRVRNQSANAGYVEPNTSKSGAKFHWAQMERVGIEIEGNWGELGIVDQE